METSNFIKLQCEGLLDAMASLCGCGLLIIDHCKQKFLYVSPNIACLYGIEAEEMMGKGLGVYLEHVPEEDLNMLLEINYIGLEKFRNIPESKCRECSISYDFCMDVNGKIVMTNHRVSPLVVSGKKLLLSLCMVSLSVSKTSGNVVFRNNDDNTVLEYNFAHRCWERKTATMLSDKEKHLLHLVARGFTSKEIAEEICKSEESVRAYRKALKKKLDAPNCLAALSQLSFNYFSHT